MNKTATLFLSMVFIIIAVSCGEQRAKNNVQEDEYVIAYNVAFDVENDNYEVFVMDMDGSNKRNITKLPGVEWTYNGFGDYLYFISDKDTTPRHYYLYKTSYNGSNFEKISDIRLNDSWLDSRKKGEELIVRPHSSIDTAFYIIDPNGKILKKIKPGLPYVNDPNFSPDGSRIVFRGAEKPFKKDSGYLDELYIIDDEGKNLKQLTHYPETDTTAQWYSYHAGVPRWHPNEGFISYHSKQNGKYSLYAVSPDGSKQWKLTNNAQNEGWHSWSPDGKWLAIELFDDDQSQFHIGLMNWKTKELKVLTDTTYRYQQAPVFLLK